MLKFIMETLGIKKGIDYKYDSGSIKKQTINVIDKIALEIKNKNYQFKNEYGDSDLNTFKYVNWDEIIERSSKKTIKKYQKYVQNFEKKKSLRSINLLLHFMYTRLFSIKQSRNNIKYRWLGGYDWQQPNDIKKVVLLPPKKELDIQAKRDKWKDAQIIADQLYGEYKDEKGDYYKNK